MIIINEREYALERIKKKNIGNNIYETLSILTKYYSEQGMKRKAIRLELKKFLDIAYTKYSINSAYWLDILEKTITKNANHELFESDGVWITESEWEKVNEFKSKIVRKVAFTLLCIAKINNQKRKSNNNWVNTEIKDIFKLANVSCSIDNRAKYLRILLLSGFFEFAKRVDNLSMKILVVDDESEKKFLVNDFRDLGHEYLYRIGENYIRCAECGKLVKNNKYGNKKYCSTCASYIPQEPKMMVCVDCGKEFVVDARITNKVRCDDCQEIYRRKYKAEKELERYHKNKNN